LQPDRPANGRRQPAGPGFTSRLTPAVRRSRCTRPVPSCGRFSLVTPSCHQIWSNKECCCVPKAQPTSFAGRTMPSNAPVTENSSTPPAKKLPRTPPEEQFWKRYSPHGELPLSGVGSLALHALVVGTLVLWSWLLWNKFNNWKPSLPV